MYYSFPIWKVFNVLIRRPEVDLRGDDDIVHQDVFRVGGIRDRNDAGREFGRDDSASGHVGSDHIACRNGILNIGCVKREVEVDALVCIIIAGGIHRVEQLLA